MSDDQDRAGRGGLESAVTDSLERRAGRVVPARLAITDIRAAAARRRRARTARLVGGATAAVAAVAVVLALLPRSADGPGRPPTAPVATPSAPTSTPTATATPAVSRALGDLPRGAAPDVGVLVGDTLCEPDFPARTIPPAARQMGVTEVTRAGAAVLVADGRIFEGTRGLSLVVDGAVTELGPCSTGAAASAPDGSSAWVTFACPESGEPGPSTLTRRTPDGATSSTTLPYPPDDNMITSAVGLVGDQVLITRGFVDGAFLVDADGTLSPVPGVTTLSTVSPDGSLGVAALRGEEAATVVDLPTGRALWQAPELLAFSPDGDLVVSDDDRPTVRAARTGRVVAPLVPPDGVRLVGDPVWEDDRHLLVVARDDVGRSVVRLGLDGSVERAGPALPDREQVLLVP